MIEIDALLLRAALAWTVLYAPIVLRRRRGIRRRSHRALAGEVRADRPLALLGLALQCAAIAISIVDRRAAPVDPLLAIPILAFVAGAGMVTVGAAARCLGRQWSLTARLRTGHRLVTRGPYARVRHPIYTATVGLFVALAAVQGGGPSLTLGAALMLAGTVVRVRTEEALLAREFGAAHRAYAGSVPSVIPGSVRWARGLLQLLALRSLSRRWSAPDKHTASPRS